MQWTENRRHDVSVCLRTTAFRCLEAIDRVGEEPESIASLQIKLQLASSHLRRVQDLLEHWEKEG